MYPPIHLRRITLSFDRPIIMGVVNLTPDSFSDGGRLDTTEHAAKHAEELVRAGASIIDIGGESTRPGSVGVDATQEMARVLPVIEALAQRELPAAISIDTSKAAVADAALRAGAEIVNDVTALADAKMADRVAAHDATLILMHMRGEPRTMQSGVIHYDDLLREIGDSLARAIDRAVAAGVARERILVDPGIGFGKTVEHNLTLSRRLGELGDLAPVVYGPSRKSFLGAITECEVDDRERATAAACAVAITNGAHVLRVHDVLATRDAINVATAMRDAP